MSGENHFKDDREAIAAGDPVWEMPTVVPGHLADLLRTMHAAKEQPEAIYPLCRCHHGGSRRAETEIRPLQPQDQGDHKWMMGAPRASLGK